MRTLMLMEWAGVTPEQYDAARGLVNWEGNVPNGAVFHVAAFSDKGLHVTDVWESPKDFQRFVQTRLMPGVQQLGIQGEPKIELHPVHGLFAPAFKALE